MPAQANPGKTAGFLWKGLVCASLLGFGAIPFVPAAGRLATLSTHGGLLALLLVTLATALWLRNWEAIHVALLSSLYLGVYCLPALGALWPLPLLLILASYGTVLACVPRARRTVRFWHRGRLDRATLAWMVAFTAVAAAALVLWRYTANADLTSYRRFVPSGIPAWAIFAGIVPFAVLNAFFEELIWRGVFWQACEAAFGLAGALALSTLSFGLAHFRGFPSGVLGVALASIYGLMMGVVRVRTKGLFWPWFAHVFADVVIFSMVAALVVFD